MKEKIEELIRELEEERSYLESQMGEYTLGKYEKVIDFIRQLKSILVTEESKPDKPTQIEYSDGQGY